MCNGGGVLFLPPGDLAEDLSPIQVLRRIFLVATSSGEGLLSDHIPGVRQVRRKRIFEPHSGLCPVGRTFLVHPPSEQNRAQV